MLHSSRGRRRPRSQTWIGTPYTYDRFALSTNPIPFVGRIHELASEIVHGHHASFQEDTILANATIERWAHGDLSDPAPVVRFRTFDLGKLRAKITVSCPCREAERLESGITLDLLAGFQAMGHASNNSTTPTPTEAD